MYLRDKMPVASQMDSFVVFSGLFVMFLVIFFLMRRYREFRLQHYEVPARDIRKGHRFYMMDIFPEQTYCNIGHHKIKHGARCDSCGICVDDFSMKEANKKIPCKPLSEVGDVPHHHWVQGNLPLYSKCYICNGDCGTQAHICDVRCAWCGRTIHENCDPTTQECDMGPFKTSIVPPNCVKLKWVGLKGRKHLVVSEAKKPKTENWMPLIVIANRKSGNNDAELILSCFRGILNPTQVIDLHDIPPENGLEWCHLLPDVTFRVLVCGGDGSIGWVLSAIENLKLQTPPQVCILPLGTGNDLSRVLGWGEGYTSEDIDVKEYIQQIQESRPIHLDRMLSRTAVWILPMLCDDANFECKPYMVRWSVNITTKRMLQKRRQLVMNNYCSIGVDALVTLNFHRQRESRPWLFAHRLINKLCYFYYGTKDVLGNECKNLHKKIKVELDGKQIDLPGIEGFVVLNISSWGGGCQPWGTNLPDQSLKPQKYDDGLLEVMALYSSFHIAQLQVGLADPIRLGQAKTIKIKLFGGKVPMQVDGEPWEQAHPAEIVIKHQSQATMLALS